MRRPETFESPACATVGGDFWFPERDTGTNNTTEMLTAKAICRTCPHRTECAEWGVNKEVHGIWGGLTPRERASIRRQRRIRIQEAKSA